MTRNEIITLNPPLSRKNVMDLEVGDLVQISGKIITARDEAYEKILESIKEGEEIPVNLERGIVYHCGPLVKQENNNWEVIAAGPTTSARLDDMQVDFVEKTGVRALIGKGGIGKKIIPEVSSLDCVYLAFTGGAAALAADNIVGVEEMFWEDLGLPEALWVLKVEDFGPLTVAVDTSGNDLYETSVF